MRYKGFQLYRAGRDAAGVPTYTIGEFAYGPPPRHEPSTREQCELIIDRHLLEQMKRDAKTTRR